jgi:hypothetical protein
VRIYKQMIASGGRLASARLSRLSIGVVSIGDEDDGQPGRREAAGSQVRQIRVEKDESEMLRTAVRRESIKSDVFYFCPAH